VLGQRPQQRRPVVDGLDHIEVVRRQQPDHPVAQQGKVLGEYHTHKPQPPLTQIRG